MLVKSQIATRTVAPDTVSLKHAAHELEAVFIDELLKSAGFGAARGAFGGGTGEAQFASFLRQEQAKAMAVRGFGLAERFEASLRGATS